MNGKKLAILATLLISIVALILISEKLSDSKKTASGNMFFSGFQPSSCAAIIISDRSGSVRLTQTATGWSVSRYGQTPQSEEVLAMDDSTDQSTEQYLADSVAVQVVLEKIQKMQRDVLVSANPEKKELFQVDSTNGLRVEVRGTGDKALGTVYIGKTGSDHGSHYVRMAGSDEVFSVSGSIKYSFFTDLKRWRNKNLFTFDPNSVTAITLSQKDSSTIVLTKSTDSTGSAIWTMSAPLTGRVKAGEADNLCSSLAKLQTSDWETDVTLTPDQTGLNKPTIQMMVTLLNGEKYSIIIGTEKQSVSQLWARINDETGLYLVGKYNLSKFQKSAQSLLETAS